MTRKDIENSCLSKFHYLTILVTLKLSTILSQSEISINSFSLALPYKNCFIPQYVDTFTNDCKSFCKTHACKRIFCSLRGCKTLVVLSQIFKETEAFTIKRSGSYDYNLHLIYYFVSTLFLIGYFSIIQRNSLCTLC